MKTDIRNAGGERVGEEVVVDKGLVISRNPKDLPACCDTIAIPRAKPGSPVDRTVLT